MRGKLIVFEGSDGTGKSTHSKLLLSYLKKQKIPAILFSFPRYTQTIWGQMVREYLSGGFGNLKSIDARLASLIYAGDRLSAKDDIGKWLEKGYIVVCDRYVASNIAHQAAKFKSQIQKTKFIKWLEHLEYKDNAIPKEDLVLFLSIPAGVSQNLMKRRKKDIHEQDEAYLKNVIAVFENLVKNRPKWVRVDSWEKGKLFTIAQVQNKIIDILKKKKII